LIKIDAEGIEAELLTAAEPVIAAARPTLVVEVLPEAARLANKIAALSKLHGYGIHVIPAYGSDHIIRVDPQNFMADTPAAHRSKDVVLSVDPL
jgi:hypothetical protein